MEAARAELARAATLQGEIWSAAVSASRVPNPQPAALLLLPALNAMIDITTTRTMATRNTSPCSSSRC